MSEKALKGIIYFAGIVCAYAFISIRVFPMFNAVLLEKHVPEYWENMKYGELYYFNFIKDFQEDDLPEHTVKYRHTNRHPDINSADIITFGDSFFDFCRMTTFPEKLGSDLNKKVHYARYDFPLQYLADSNYHNTEQKIFLYETAERFLPGRFESPQKVTQKIEEPKGLKQIPSKILSTLFVFDTEVLYSQLLSRSYFTTHLYSLVATIKFDGFGIITPKTPKYSTEYDIPWLFGWRQIDNDIPSSFYYKHTDEEIDNYCNNIKLLADDCKDQYNFDFVFMIIPSKYTIYHNLLNNDEYNNFIPRLHEGLDKRNIKYINIYDTYMAERDKNLLYYGTDTHWTEKGRDIALDKAKEVLTSIEDYSSVANTSKAKTSSCNITNSSIR